MSYQINRLDHTGWHPISQEDMDSILSEHFSDLAVLHDMMDADREIRCSELKPTQRFRRKPEHE